MTGQEGAFFDQLAQRGHDPWLDKIEGTVRFDITDGGQVRHWTLAIRNGVVTVRPENGPADSVVQADVEAFDRLSRGQLRLLPAWLRNEIAVEGRFVFVLILERILQPPRPTDRPLRGVARGAVATNG